MAQSKRLTIAAIAVLFGSGMLRYLLVERQLPPRRFFLGAATVGAFQALASDVRPQEAKYLAYLIMVGAVMANTIPVVEELGNLRVEDEKGAKATPPPDFDQGDYATTPVFMRGPRSSPGAFPNTTAYSLAVPVDTRRAVQPTPRRARRSPRLPRLPGPTTRA
jgi:hypothetical protein